MKNNNTIGKKWDFKNETLEALLEDPTRSSKQMAEELRITRQKLWREKKLMEEEGLIWGYTAVVDEGRGDWVHIIVLLRLANLSEDAISGVISMAKEQNYEKYNVRVKDAFYVDGEYDGLISYAAPDIMTARRFYEYLRLKYEPYLTEKPVMMEVNFALRREGKLNPRTEGLKALQP